MAAIAWLAPAWRKAPSEDAARVTPVGYAEVWLHPYFQQMLPLGFIHYGGMVAMQTLWWMKDIVNKHWLDGIRIVEM